MDKIIQKVDEYYTEEALAANDGKKVPLRKGNGPIIGEATLKYDSQAKALKAELRVDDPEMARFLDEEPPSPSIFMKEL